MSTVASQMPIRYPRKGVFPLCTPLLAAIYRDGSPYTSISIAPVLPPLDSTTSNLKRLAERSVSKYWTDEAPSSSNGPATVPSPATT